MAKSREQDGNELIELAIRALGPSKDQLVRLRRGETVTAANFEYADLLLGRSDGQRVRAVVQKDGSPLVYLARGSPAAADTGQSLAQLLANRAETSVLVEVLPGQSGSDLGLARVWPCRLDAQKHQRIDLADPAQAGRILGDLQEGLWSDPANAHQEQRLRDLLVTSVRKVTDIFLQATDTGRGRRSEEALALVGRALFVRFLVDRNILTAVTAPRLWAVLGADAASAFDGPRQAAAVCQWLDMTFNGDIMPLPAEGGYQRYFEELVSKYPDAMRPLGWIVAKTDAGGQLPLWNKLDFSHIPVGTLSEVYEDYAHREHGDFATSTSVHFTPRHLAKMMVRQAMAGLAQDEVAAAKILDPAVGAGVFLSFGFRELVRHRALADGRWPSTELLRDILYRQLRGLDINFSALKLSALTLYLTAIELDANPIPPEKLKFEHALLGTVLHDVSDEKPRRSPLGSLKSSLHIGSDFSIVIGNPPWTAPKRSGAARDEAEEESDERPSAHDEFEREVEAIATACISERWKQSPLALERNPSRYEHPDKVPDLAFLWKATQWARPGGIICFVVAQRLLIKRGGNWPSAREAFFSSVQVDGVLDASEFANHKQLLWPGIELPFCVLFARNQAPAAEHVTQLVTLTVEPILERRRQLRIDPLAPTQLRLADLDQKPAGIVPRIRGCELDQALIQRWEERRRGPEHDQPTPNEGIRAEAPLPGARQLALWNLGDYLTSIALGRPKRGFKRGARGAKVPRWYEDLPADARQINVKSGDRWAGEVSAAAIQEPFKRTALKSAPEPQWYKPPMLLIKQAMGDLGEMSRTLLVTVSGDDVPVLYPFAFVGAPLPNEPGALLEAKYVSLWVNSCVYSYYQTLTSTQFGFGIKALYSDDIEAMPVLPLQDLFAHELTTKEEILTLFDGLARSDFSVADQIDAWACRVMGCDEVETALIHDTLSVTYPIGESRNIGRSWVSQSALQECFDRLKQELEETSDIIDPSSLELLKPSMLPGWRFVAWRLTSPCSLGNGQESIADLDEAALLGLVRDNYPAGQVWGTTKDGRQVFGQLALPKYWLGSRAALSAQLITSWADQFSA